MTTSPDHLLTQREVAAALRCSKRHVRDLIGKRRLAAVVVSARKILIPAAALDRFIARSTTTPNDERKTKCT